MTSDNGYCVYLHKRKDNHDVVYVGQGRVTRANSLSKSTARNKAHLELLNNVGLYCEILSNNLTKEEAEALEQELIAKFRAEGHLLTNKASKANSSKTYLREEYEDKFYIDPSSPSGLRWKTDRYSLGDRGTLLAKKDSIAGHKCRKSGYWTYISKRCHRIVYALHHGQCDAMLTIDHIDGNKDNNSIENLELVTPGENSRRAAAKVIPKKGSEVHSSKVVEQDILDMYRLFEEGASNDEVAERYSLHSRYVSLIRHGKRWIHLYEQYGKTFPCSEENRPELEQKVILAYKLIQETDMTNKQIAGLVNIDVSSISRLRTGKLYTKIIAKHLQPLDNPSPTI